MLAIEEHYAEVREGIPEGPRRLLREYIDQGRLGVKSGRGSRLATCCTAT